ncbi:restriction endonuclease [Methanofollis aquaemaris]|uniref:Restriction endonuclease n=2 Tax=Methanofollis aquaemaris TaxID=126734 RepID=A0A8A3S6L9_9EURY|nr:restriction endonuclease [Methanofollis aquaemaris]
MPVPSYEEFMLPMLHVLEDGEIRQIKEVRTELADILHLTDDDKIELLPSGKMTVFRSRVGWAKTYLKKAGLVDNSKRGMVKITERGVQVLQGTPEKMDSEFLLQFDEFQTFVNGTKTETPENVDPKLISPEEMLEQSYQEIKNSLASDLLDQILSMSPDFFEKLVVDLLVAMGYGGSRSDAGKVVGQSGDGGIDGIIKMDKLGIDEIYIQAKRWDRAHSVDSREIRNFIGSLTVKGARKGVFITTSKFTDTAKSVAQKPNFKVALIDGAKLVDLMIEYDLGVSTYEKYTIKKIDHDYFSED